MIEYDCCRDQQLQKAMDDAAYFGQRGRGCMTVAGDYGPNWKFCKLPAGHIGPHLWGLSWLDREDARNRRAA